VTGDDFMVFRPVLSPILARVQRSAWGRRTEGVDLDELVELGTTVLRGTTMTRPQLAKKLAERWPDTEPTALAWSLQYLTPLVHPPPDGLWGRKGGHTPIALAADWLGQPIGGPDADRLDESRTADLIRIYLAAFGPATLRDIHAWSGLSRLGDVVDSLRPELVTIRDPNGVELFDLPDAPRPDPGTPAPIRFLPEFDNVLLAYHDRGRMMTKDQQARVGVGAAVAATLLIDGFVHGMWHVTRTETTATLTIDLFAPLTNHHRAQVDTEAHRLLHFLTPDLPNYEVRTTD
jgi:hypothetical protein